MAWTGRGKRPKVEKLSTFIRSEGRTFVKRKNGVSTIVRDTYGTDSDWYALVAAVRKRDKYKCVFCPATTELTTHHMIPLSRGGTTTMRNLVTACKECHRQRHKHL